MKPSLTFICTVALLAAGLLTGCGSDAPTAGPEAVETYPGKLEVLSVEAKSVPILYEVVGTINAKTTTTLAAKISGHIEKVTVDEGDRVKSGEDLIIIDDRDISARMDQAEAGYLSARKSMDEIESAIRQATDKKRQAQAGLELAQSTHDRYAKLFEEKAVSAQEFDQIKTKRRVAQAEFSAAQEEISRLTAKKAQVSANIEQARSAVEEANIMKGYARLKAPFDGIIVKKQAEVGALAVPGMPLLTLENPEGFRLEVDVRENEFAGKVEIGREVEVRIDALGDRKIIGHVAEAVPLANPMSRTFKVKIALPAEDGISGGMYGKAMCYRGERTAILVPAKALIRRGQLEQVFVVDSQNVARLRLVKTGKTYEGQIEILSGLDPGERIIAHPPLELKDGNRIEVSA